MKDLNQPQALALLGTAATVACLGLAMPAQAHDVASHAGLMAGVLHPLVGLDHLLLLVAVGGAAAALSPLLLGWALTGGLIGAGLASMASALPGLELLAALAISAVALLTLRRSPFRLQDSIPAGGIVALAVAVHAMLHGLEAPTGGGVALWWLGTLASSSLTAVGSYALLRRLPAGWTQRLALLLVVLGGAAALSL